ncbi:MAG: hypothetical protein DLM62_00085 [Pseudonocardiales bacterium]|nr:MAG: hypothetical protein DLM62_00085 [Pseudonocardiales bacterium]
MKPRLSCAGVGSSAAVVLLALGALTSTACEVVAGMPRRAAGGAAAVDAVGAGRVGGFFWAGSCADDRAGALLPV